MSEHAFCCGKVRDTKYCPQCGYLLINRTFVGLFFDAELNRRGMSAVAELVAIDDFVGVEFTTKRIGKTYYLGIIMQSEGRAVVHVDVHHETGTTETVWLYDGNAFDELQYIIKQNESND